MKPRSDSTAPVLAGATDSPSARLSVGSPPVSHPAQPHGDLGRRNSANTPMLLTLNEVASELRCARRSVERHIAAHEIRTVRFGRCVRVERAELLRFIAGHTDRHREVDDATSA